MKKLHILLIKSFLGPLVLTFLLTMFILLLQFLWKYIDDLVGKGLSFAIIAELLFYTSASLVSMALPLAILFASIMTFGNLGENYELLACKAAGISLQRVMFPLIIIVIGLTYGAYVFANNVLPYSNLKMKTLLHSIKHQDPEIQIPTGTFYAGIPNYTIKIEEKDSKSNLLKDIIIYNHANDRVKNPSSIIGRVNVTYADSGRISMTEDETQLAIVLYNGYAFHELEEKMTKRNKASLTYPHRKEFFGTRTMNIDITQEFIRTDEEFFSKSYQMLNLDQLHHEIDSIGELVDTLKRTLNKELTKKTYFKNDLAVFRNNDYYHPKKPEEEAAQFNIDSVYSSLSLHKRKSAVRQALTYSRGNKQQIQNINVRVQSKVKHMRRYQVALHQKYSFPFACFIFFFIGAPLGAIIRKGGLGLPAIISLLFFILYYIVSLSGEKFVKEDMTPAYIGMWLSSAVLLPLGIFLTYKATTDSVILNSEVYFEYFTKLFKKKIDPDKVFNIPYEKKFRIPEPTIEVTIDNISESLNSLLKESDKIVSNLGKIEYSEFIEYIQKYEEVYGALKNNDMVYNIMQTQLNELPYIEPRRYKQIVGLRKRFFGTGMNTFQKTIGYVFTLLNNYGKLYELKDLLELIHKKTFHFINIIDERIAER